ncbi:MAG: lysophospholipid acyltransferase family protein [Paracoccaceae bacterium]
MSLRKKIETSQAPTEFLARIFAGYLRLCLRTVRWKVIGEQDLHEDLRAGPVIMVTWHARLMLAPPCWPHDKAVVSTLRDPSPAGNLSAATQSRLGVRTILMSATQSNFAASRRILKNLRAGNSLGLTLDGPRGPARVAKQAAIEWARASGCPVYLFAWSGRPAIRLKTWDRTMLPLPFARGTYAFRRWNIDIPRKLNEADYARLRHELGAQLDALTREVDTLTGAPPDP